MNQILVVQHCQSEHHVNGMTGGWTNTPLTELGTRQAEEAAERLSERVKDEPCEIVSSDLRRARQTADIIGCALTLPVRVLPSLRELNGGAATGQTHDWARKNIDRSNWSLFDWAGFDGAETWRQFHARVVTCMEELVGTNGPMPIIVAHGGTLSNIVTWWLRLPLDALPERNPFSGSPGGITFLKKNQHGNPVVGYLNDTAHLDGIR